MNLKLKQRITEELEALKTNKGLSYQDIATQVGVNKGVVGFILRNEWKENDKLVSDTMFRRFQGFLNISDEWVVFNTWNYSQIKNLCNDAQGNSRMLMTYGYTGYGKTTALKNESIKPNRFYLLCDFLMTQKSFLIGVAKTMGLSIDGRKQDLMVQVVKKIVELDKPLLILDDVGKVNDRIFRLIQVIYDRTEGRLGIVLAGTDYLNNYLTKMADKDKMGFQELTSRIAYKLTLVAPKRGEIKHICTENGITSKLAVNYIIRAAKEYRTLKSIISNAKKAADGEEITVDLLMSLKESQS